MKMPGNMQAMMKQAQQMQEKMQAEVGAIRVDRIGRGSLEEVIVATNPTVEDEATAVYLSKLLKPLGMKVTRIAMGVPVGSDLEFADEVTMWKAMEGRWEIQRPPGFQSFARRLASAICEAFMSFVRSSRSSTIESRSPPVVRAAASS